MRVRTDQDVGSLERDLKNYSSFIDYQHCSDESLFINFKVRNDTFGDDENRGVTSK